MYRYQLSFSATMVNPEACCRSRPEGDDRFPVAMKLDMRAPMSKLTRPILLRMYLSVAVRIQADHVTWAGTHYLGSLRRLVSDANLSGSGSEHLLVRLPGVHVSCFRKGDPAIEPRDLPGSRDCQRNRNQRLKRTVCAASRYKNMISLWPC